MVLRGPGEDMNRIRIPENITAGLSPSVAAKLNERQKVILAEIVRLKTVHPRAMDPS